MQNVRKRNERVVTQGEVGNGVRVVREGCVRLCDGGKEGNRWGGGSGVKAEGVLGDHNKGKRDTFGYAKAVVNI
ncbi:hypothetical protein E3N88_19959 [Mikania micrantha]|uniref:Cyclic nucleotide-binding domain-containing protein n=1 Tax=Mikania micrantha TaxID=192012 RepID=A0A5N6NIG6_9ASTR|nr:hypothetical protein E3N88_19959 [Mikania micrantha]